MKNKKILFGILLGILFLVSMGSTYAYFNLTSSGNDNASTITINDSTLKLTYDGGMQISGTSIEPSNTTPIGTKTITITNDGTDSVYYLLHWQELYNELVRQNSSSEDELYITATCTSYTNYGESTQAVSGTCIGFTKDIPTQSTLYTYSSGKVSDTYKLKECISIESGITQVYSVSIYFRNENYSQNYNQNKQFYGSIGVSESEAPVVTIRSSLSSYSWSEIEKLSNALVAGTITTSQLSSTYNINVGDTTASVSIVGREYTFRLVGLLHDVGEYDNTLGMTFEQTDLINRTYAMKSSMTSSDSWDNSDLKTTINNLSLPADLHVVIKPAKKPCVTSVSDSTITYVTSELWIMSETEMFGTQRYTKGSAAEGTQYEYYVTNNSNVAKRKQKSGTYYSYWLRSAYYWNSASTISSFAYFYNNLFSPLRSTSSRSAYGVALCFCI